VSLVFLDFSLEEALSFSITTFTRSWFVFAVEENANTCTDSNKTNNKANDQSIVIWFDCWSCSFSSCLCFSCLCFICLFSICLGFSCLCFICLFSICLGFTCLFFCKINKISLIGKVILLFFSFEFFIIHFFSSFLEISFNIFNFLLFCFSFIDLLFNSLDKSHTLYCWSC